MYNISHVNIFYVYISIVYLESETNHDSIIVASVYQCEIQKKFARKTEVLLVGIFPGFLF